MREELESSSLLLLLIIFLLLLHLHRFSNSFRPNKEEMKETSARARKGEG